MRAKFLGVAMCVCMVTFMASLSVSTTAFAGNFFLAPQVGTLGVGVNAGYQFNKNVKARFNINYFELSHDDNFQSVKYDADLKNLTTGILADIHPFDNGFRMTFGMYLLDLDVDVTGKLKDNKTYKIGDNRYTAAQLGDISGSIDWNHLAPYVGMGWGTDGGTDSGFGMQFDLGVMFISGASVSYNATGAASLAALQADINREAKDLQSKVNKYSAYPVISVGLSYRF